MNNVEVKNKGKGFSLVEISIVLVIIGLLLGGVLKGQEMIKSAKFKAQRQQINGIIAMINTYVDRYEFYPGDDADASSRFYTTRPTGFTDGNGNGVITKSVEGERSVWQHLSAAGLLTGYKNRPNGEFINKYGGGTYVETNVAGLDGIANVCTSLPGKIAGLYDSKEDDGVPNTGIVRVAGVLAAYPATTSTSSASIVVCTITGQ